MKSIRIMSLSLFTLFFAQVSFAQNDNDPNDPIWIHQRVAELNSVEGSLLYLSNSPTCNPVPNYLDLNCLKSGVDKIISVTPNVDQNVNTALAQLKSALNACPYTFGMGISPDCYSKAINDFHATGAVANAMKALRSKVSKDAPSAKLQAMVDEYNQKQKALAAVNDKIQKLQKSSECNLASTNQSEASSVRAPSGSSNTNTSVGGSSGKATNTRGP